MPTTLPSLLPHRHNRPLLIIWELQMGTEMSARETGKRILIIDDDELSRDVLTLLLEAQGHLVDSAISGDYAVKHTVLFGS